MILKDKTDEEIVKIVQTIDQELYSVIVDRYQQKLFRYVNIMIRDVTKSNDIVQETLIKSFINLKSFDTKKKFSSWIYRIAHNETLNIIKKSKFTIELNEIIDIISHEDIELNYEKSEIKENVQNCLNSIPFIYREAIILYAIEEKSYDEISEILKIPMGTVATRISRAKVILKKICQTK